MPTECRDFTPSRVRLDPVPRSPPRLWPADLDGDGRDEALRWDPMHRVLSATLFTATGDVRDEMSFEGPWQSANPDFMTGDFDGDGRAEFLARDPGAPTLTVVGVVGDGSMRGLEVPSLAFSVIGYRLRPSVGEPDRLLVQTDAGGPRREPVAGRRGGGECLARE